MTQMPSDKVLAKRRKYSKYKQLHLKYTHAVESGDGASIRWLEDEMQKTWREYVSMEGEQPPLHFHESTGEPRWT